MPTKRTYTDHGDACATAHAMELLGDRWTYPILRELMLTPKRFSELTESVRGVTPAVLTSRLRELEKSGLIERISLPAPTRATAYRITAWGAALQPIFNALGRWAQESPGWDTSGCGLTPDAVVQSMLTMAPNTALTTPAELELRLRDEREPATPTYTYRLWWAAELSIRSGSAPHALATVIGDSSTWAKVLYEGYPLTRMRLDGDLDEVHRVVTEFARGGAQPRPL